MAGPGIEIRISAAPAFDGIIENYNFTEKQVKQIGSAAINRTLATVRSRIVKRLAEKINLRQKDIRDAVTIKKASYENMEGQVNVTRKHVPLFDFVGFRQTKTGVSIQVLKDGPREVLTGTFIATMPTGHEGIFERGSHLPTKGPNVGNPRYTLIPGRRYRAAGRFIIFERFGLSLTGYLAETPQFVAEEQENAGDVLLKNVASQIERRLAQNKAAE